MDSVIKFRRCVREEGKKQGERSILVVGLTGVILCIVTVLAEFGRIPRTWQNLAEIADCGRERHIVADCGRNKWKQVDMCKISIS